MEAVTCWGLWARMSLTSFLFVKKELRGTSETLCQAYSMVTAVNSAVLDLGS